MAAKAKEPKKAIKKVVLPKAKQVRSFMARNSVFFLALVVVLLAGVAYYFKGYFVVATVNGRPIYRYSVVRQLEVQGGQEVLQGKITEALIREEAARRKVEVTEPEIESKVASLQSEFQAQGQDLQQILEIQGMTMDQLKKQIKIQLIVEKMFGSEVDVTEEEVNKYLEDYGDTLPEYDNEEAKLQAVRQNLEQTELVDSFQGWLQTAQSEADIKYLFNY